MNPKTRNILGLLAFVALIGALSLLSSCTPPGESIRDRIETFISAVNDRDSSTFKDCLDPDATAYSTASNSAWIAVAFPATDYEISAFLAVGKTATVTFSSSSSATLPITFEMTENKGSLTEGTTYSIRRMKVTGTSVYFFE